MLRAVTTIVVVGWVLLTQTSAKLLLPNLDALKDRLKYAWSFHAASSPKELKLKICLLFLLVKHLLVILPLAAYLWMIDELLFGNYRDVEIRKPIITISVPRAGTTSFHRTLAMDERFVTPTMLELVIPFLCVQKLIHALRLVSPLLVSYLEQFLKYLNGITAELEARHPISLFMPDADDILLGEWHWVSVGACRTFPAANYWVRHYQMDLFPSEERRRSLLFHRRMCQKVLHNRGHEKPCRLLLRSHLSCCIEDFQVLYPDAVVVGIIRDPVDVLRSFAGLSAMAIFTATGKDILAEIETELPKESAKDAKLTTKPLWSAAFEQILSDMMGREGSLYGGDNRGAWKGRCHFVTFHDFKNEPLETLESLYEKSGLSITHQFRKDIREGIAHHETYKKRHVYHNPTLAELGVRESEYKSLPAVNTYANLLERKTPTTRENEMTLHN